MDDLTPRQLASSLDTTPAEFRPGFAGKTGRCPNGTPVDGYISTYCGTCYQEVLAAPGDACPDCGRGTVLQDEPGDETE